MKLRKIIAMLTATAMAAAALTGCGGSKEYPSQNISVICPYSAGGTTDLCVRGMTESIPDGVLPSGVNITANNVTGGAGLVGANQFRNSSSDGYTLGIVNCDLVLSKVNGNTDISYDEFTPLACLMKQPNLILVSADAPYDTFEEFVEYAKAHPGEVKVGNTGEGTLTKLSAQSFEQALGLEFTYVNYDGDTNSITGVVAGEVDMTCCSAAPAIGQLTAGTIKALAITDNERTEMFPDVPAMGELYEELKDIRILTWVYLAIKNDAPEEVVTYLQDAFAQASATEEFEETLAAFSIMPAEFEGTDGALQFMQEQYEFYDSLIN